MKKLILIFSIIAFSSCSSIKFYNASDDTEENGVQFYYPKPFLLVTPSVKDGGVKTISSEIIYLPDLANPKRAVLKSGFGSSNLSLSLSNGVLTAVGQQSDSKIPETITGIGGLATAIAGLKLDGDNLDPILYEIKYDGKKIVLEKVVVN